MERTLLINILYSGRFSEKSFREFPKRDVIPIPIEIITNITIIIEPIVGIPRERSFFTIGQDIKEMKIANKKGMRISLEALIPATTITKAAKLYNNF